MKYLGYALFFLVIAVFSMWGTATKFLANCYELAPEITMTVGLIYGYVLILTIFYTVIDHKHPARISLYSMHVKMGCSVMVSLGLVGTFLGLVDMISGIAVALSSEEPDFSKKMKLLLGAISGSLGAMSYAFITSILGVGMSAYTMVAATFIETDFRKTESRRRQAIEKEEKEEAERLRLEEKAEAEKTVEGKLAVLESHMNKLRLLQTEVEVDLLTPGLILEQMARERENNNAHQQLLLKELHAIRVHLVDINNKKNTENQLANTMSSQAANIEDVIKQISNKLDVLDDLVKMHAEQSEDNRSAINKIVNKADDAAYILQGIRDDLFSVNELHEIGNKKIDELCVATETLNKRAYEIKEWLCTLKNKIINTFA